MILAHSNIKRPLAIFLTVLIITSTIQSTFVNADGKTKEEKSWEATLLKQVITPDYIAIFKKALIQLGYQSSYLGFAAELIPTLRSAIGASHLQFPSVVEGAYQFQILNPSVQVLTHSMTEILDERGMTLEDLHSIIRRSKFDKNHDIPADMKGLYSQTYINKTEQEDNRSAQLELSQGIEDAQTRRFVGMVEKIALELATHVAQSEISAFQQTHKKNPRVSIRHASADDASVQAREKILTSENELAYPIKSRNKIEALINEDGTFLGRTIIGLVNGVSSLDNSASNGAKAHVAGLISSAINGDKASGRSLFKQGPALSPELASLPEGIKTPLLNPNLDRESRDGKALPIIRMAWQRWVNRLFDTTVRRLKQGRLYSDPHVIMNRERIAELQDRYNDTDLPLGMRANSLVSKERADAAILPSDVRGQIYPGNSSLRATELTPIQKLTGMLESEPMYWRYQAPLLMKHIQKNYLNVDVSTVQKHLDHVLGRFGLTLNDLNETANSSDPKALADIKEGNMPLELLRPHAFYFPGEGPQRVGHTHEQLSEKQDENELWDFEMKALVTRYQDLRNTKVNRIQNDQIANQPEGQPKVGLDADQLYRIKLLSQYNYDQVKLALFFRVGEALSEELISERTQNLAGNKNYVEQMKQMALDVFSNKKAIDEVIDDAPLNLKSANEESTTQVKREVPKISLPPTKEELQARAAEVKARDQIWRAEREQKRKTILAKAQEEAKIAHQASRGVKQNSQGLVDIQTEAFRNTVREKREEIAARLSRETEEMKSAKLADEKAAAQNREKAKTEHQQYMTATKRGQHEEAGKMAARHLNLQFDNSNIATLEKALASLEAEYKAASSDEGMKTKAARLKKSVEKQARLLNQEKMRVRRVELGLREPLHKACVTYFSNLADGIGSFFKVLTP